MTSTDDPVTRTAGREGDILNAALQVFRAKGYHGSSMQDIADAVGLRKGSLYHYITSKEELLGRIFQAALGPLLAEAQEIAARPAPTSAKLEALLEAHLRAIASNLEALSVYLHEWRVLEGSELDTVRQQRRRYKEIVEAILAEGIGSGELRAHDHRVVALGILGMANWVYTWYRPEGRLPPEEIARIFARLLMDGLEART